MTKARTQQIQPENPDPIDLTGLETGEMLNPALEAIFAEMGQDQLGKIKVYISKLVEDTGKEARVWEGPPADYDLMVTARRFGSGDYRVKVYVPHESGRIVIRGNNVFTILLDPSEDAKIVALRNGSPVSVAQVQQSQITPESLAIAFASAIKAAMPAPVDPLQQMDRLAGVMQKLLPSQTTVPVGNSFMEILNAAKSLMEVTRGFNPPIDAEGKTDVKGLAIARGVDLLAKMFEKSVESAKPNPSIAGNQQALAAPFAGNDDAAAQTLTPEQQEDLEMNRLQIKMINREAKAKTDPITLVDKFYEDLPEAVFDLIVFEKDWFGIICANVPECTDHKTWYEALRSAIIAKGIKEGDLEAESDGSLSFTEEPDTSATGA